MERLLIVDDHRMFGESLSVALSSYMEGLDVRLAFSGQSAIDAFELGQRFDVVILDLDLPNVDGKTTFQRLREMVPDQAIAFVSASRDPADLLWAFENGANSFIPKTFRFEALCAVIEIVGANGSYFPAPRDLGASLPSVDLAKVSTAPANGRPPLDLTRRQFEIAALVAEGESNKAIAHRLGISEVTVKMHLRKTMQKLQLTNRTQLASMIWKSGLSQSPS